MRLRIARSRNSVMVASGRYLRDSLKPTKHLCQLLCAVEAKRVEARTFGEQGNVITVLLDHLCETLAQAIVVGECADFGDSAEVEEGLGVQLVHLGERRIGCGQVREREVLRDLQERKALRAAADVAER